MENKHTIGDLYQMQSLPLSAKIRMTENRIRQWYDAWDGDVYVSFSGGKDSTVLLDIARRLYPDMGTQRRKNCWRNKNENRID